MRRARAHPGVIVVGASASGAHLLAAALAGHSQLVTIGDNGRWGDRLRVLTTGGAPSTDHAHAAIGAMLEQVPQSEAADALALALRALAEALPKALIVHVVRDGRAVAVVRARSSPDGNGMHRWANRWIEELIPLLSFEADHPQRVVKVPYEGLLMAPETELESLCMDVGLAPEQEQMSAAFRAACAPGDDFAFRSDSLDPRPLLELEGFTQPALVLLGYRPAADLEGVARLRRDAERYAAARAEAEVLRAELQDPPSAVDDGDDVVVDRPSAERAPPDLAMLRWKAKRYDQIRAAASPLVWLKRRRARRRTGR